MRRIIIALCVVCWLATGWLGGLMTLKAGKRTGFYAIESEFVQSGGVMLLGPFAAVVGVCAWCGVIYDAEEAE